MSRQKVVIVSTGGTIAFKYDPARKGAFPGMTGAELVEAVPSLADVCPVETIEFANMPSPHMTPSLMFKLAQVLDELLSREDAAGAVVTHGTDTLEETAYLLDLTLNTTKPVCLTAAMRSGTSVSPDGPRNILCAVKTAASPRASGTGVLVVMNEEIHAAREVTKTHTANVKSFTSPFWGPLGCVDEDKVIFRRQPLHSQKIRPEKLVEEVYLVKLTAGSDDLLLKCLVQNQAKGIVLEGLGRGNVPPAVVPGIKLALEKSIPVVLTTRSAGGRVLDVYGYEGGARHLKEMGVILAGEISGPKARLKLMLLLGLTKNSLEISKYFGLP